jgi:hypothetical protein
MRSLVLAFAVALSLFAAPVALAAPNCVDRNGDPIKCGVQGAMPVGWTLSPQQLSDREMSHPMDADMNELLKAICVIGLFLALIALLPEFDGSRGEDWDRQEGDNEKRK